jgi:hypothetical protein
MTELSSDKQRTVRSVNREKRGTVNDETLNESWWNYKKFEKLDFSFEEGWVSSPAMTPGATGVALKRMIFGEGAERMVSKFREVAPDGRFVGPLLVAKQSRFIEDIDNRDLKQFHKVFYQTQLRSQELAVVFNEAILKLPISELAKTKFPQIQFLECSVYMVHDVNLGRNGILVEKMLDEVAYKKWNSNDGYVDGQVKVTTQRDNLDEIKEEDEEEEDDESEEHELIWNIADIPQAFSHFTYYKTQRKCLVCDLQGVIDTSGHSPVFELTDPVIHYRSGRGRKNVFGRTDKGKKGMHDFFLTHKCSELCRALKRLWIKIEGDMVVKKLSSSGGGASGGPRGAAAWAKMAGDTSVLTAVGDAVKT